MKNYLPTLFRSLLILLIFSFLSSESFGQQISSKVWQESTLSSSERTDSKRVIKPSKFKVYELDFASFTEALSEAPMRFTTHNRNAPIIEIPLPNGTSEKFRIERSDVLHPNLAKKYPEISAYTGVSLSNHSTTIKISKSHKSIDAMILTENNSTVYIDPVTPDTKEKYLVYYKKDHVDTERMQFECLTENEKLKHDDHNHSNRYGDCQLRKYKLALACTGEYATYHGGTKPDVMAAFNTAMNRVNGIYERDATITMEIIEGNDTLIFLDSATDPYTNNEGGTMLGQNQNTLDQIIGFDNYDIGHVFSTGGGGIASLRSPCTERKAQGVTGLGNPIGDHFWVDYVAHEMGHQYGGNHTQNNGCNRNSSTAMEPGSASTIMGYAGICDPNVQNNSDDYFHAISLEEMADFVVAGNGGCAELIEIVNTPPSIEGITTSGTILPISTPFFLEGSAIDGDDDAITYCWEQMDPETAPMPPESTSDVGPAFRTYNPTLNPRRYFPQLSDILSGSNFNTWERLPSVSREMTFNLTVRDNNPVGGCTDDSEISISFDDSAGPFLVTSQNTSENWEAGDAQTITWDVANTDLAPISATNVDIYLSLDGGLNFNIPLALNTPNDGEEVINAPYQTTEEGRIMVKASNSVFFDINNSDISIVSPFSLSFDDIFFSICDEDELVYTFEFAQFDDDNPPVVFSVTDLPTGVMGDLSIENVESDTTIEVTISGLSSLPAGNYTFNFVGDNGENESIIQLGFVKAPSTSPILMLVQPANGAQDTENQIVLDWQDSDGIDQYNLQLATNPDFQNPIIDINLGSSTYTTPSLATGTVYYWRVRALSECFTSSWIQESWSFQTFGFLCNEKTSIPNLEIPEASESIIRDTLFIDDTDPITTLNVSMTIYHTYIGDLIARLIAPTGDTITLFDRPGNPNSNFGCSGDNMMVTFSDSALDSYDNFEATCGGSGEFSIEGSFMPMETLLGLSGENFGGDWILEIEDVFSQDGGSLASWSLSNCTDNSLPAAVLLENNTLMMDNETVKPITTSHLEVMTSFPPQAQFIVRTLPTHGDLLLNDVMLTVGEIFTQEDINNSVVTYEKLEEEIIDEFYFDVLDENDGYLAYQRFEISLNSEFPSFSINYLNDISCFGDLATIEIIASGGLPPYTYSLDGNAQGDNAVFPDLGPDEYLFSVEDSNGNTYDQTITLTEPDVLELDATITENTVEITATGGTPPYQYSINGGETFGSDNSYTLLNGENYTVVIRDANGCEASSEEFTHYFITNVLVTIGNVLCKGDSTGSIIIDEVEGGLSPFTYTVEGVGTSENGQFQNLIAGTYTLNVADNDGNTFSIDIDITEPVIKLLINTTVDNKEITINGNGGTPPYMYSLDNVNYQDEKVFTVDFDGEYTGYVKDANGCVESSSLIIISTSTSDADLSQINAYPNPVRDVLTIDYSGISKLNYEIYTINSQLVKKGSLDDIKTINVEELLEGLYILKLKTTKSVTAIQFTKQ